MFLLLPTLILTLPAALCLSWLVTLRRPSTGALCSGSCLLRGLGVDGRSSPDCGPPSPGALEDHESRYSPDQHLSSDPVSFYMQAPFHRWFGPGLLSAHLAVATFSVLAAWPSIGSPASSSASRWRCLPLSCFQRLPARSAGDPEIAPFFPYAAQADEPIELEKDLIIWLGCAPRRVGS